MPSSQITKHLVVDLQTGFAYGIKLDAEGKCKGVQPLNVAIETLDGRLVNKFGPAAGNKPAQPAANTVPYGKTTYAIEMTQDGGTGEIFTLVWPKKEDADKN